MAKGPFADRSDSARVGDVNLTAAPLSPAFAAPAPGARSFSSRRRIRAVTLVEVMIASTVLAVMCGGIISLIIQSRRMTEGSIVQNSIVTVMQGYVEQVKSMEYGLLAPSPPSLLSPQPTIPTVKSETEPDALTLSWGTPPTSLPAIGTVPTGAVDNVKTIDIRTPLNADGTPATLNLSDRIELTVWIWVVDLTDLPNNIGGSKAVTVIYTYKFRDGGRTKSLRGSLRTIRSVVPSF